MKKSSKHKVLRSFLVTALVIIMSLGTALPAFADDGDGAIIGEEGNPATAALTKMLVMPEGTTTPTATFKFTFTPTSYNGSTSATDLAAMPKVNTTNEVSVPFAATDLGSDSGGIKRVPLESPELTALIPFDHAGVYMYTVTETAGTYTINDPTKETMDYSGGSYTLTFWVRDKTVGTGVYVHAIAAKIAIKDNSDQGEVGTKVDPTPGGDPLVLGDYSKMIFTNTYHKIKGGPNPTDEALRISNKVTGDSANTDLYFSYNVLLTKPATLTNEVDYKAYIVNTANEVVTSSAHVGTANILTDGAGNKYITITTATAATINLKHGERIVFNNLHVGAKYAAVQAGMADYTPVVSIVINGAPAISLNASMGDPLSTETRLIGEGANSADYLNTFKEMPITGLIINNLPFILILALAAGGLVVFVAAKSRKKNRIEA